MTWVRRHPVRAVALIPPALLVCLWAIAVVTAHQAASVHVRWAPDVTAADREEVEQRYLLTDPELQSGTTWVYILLDTSGWNLAGLVADPRVEDTDGFDRESHEIHDRVNRRTSLVHALPGIRHPRTLQHVQWTLLLLSLPALAWAAIRLREGLPLERPWRRAACGVSFVALAGLGYLASNQRLTADDSFSVWIAQAFLRGDRPYIDFFDAGAPGWWWLSLVGQWASGGRVIGEIAVAVFFDAVALVLTYLLAKRATRSMPLALSLTAIATVCVLAAAPYGYVKAIIYPLAVLVLWWYLDAPSRRRAAVVGAVVAAAFLLRHDHGAYVGAAAAVTLLSGLVRDGVRPVAAHSAIAGVTTLALLLPLLLVVQQREGLGGYFRARNDLAAYLGLGESRPRPTLAALWPIVGPAPVWPTRVTVRWREGLPEPERTALAEAHGLTPARNDLHWLTNMDAANVRALIRHPDVRTVIGVDALTYRDSEITLVRALRNDLARRGLVPFPRALGTPQAALTLYSIVLVLPFVALLLVAVSWKFDREWSWIDGQRALAIAVLAVVAHYGLARRPGQILETSPLDVVLLGSVLGQLAGILRARTWAGAPPARWLGRASITAVVGTVMLLAASIADAGGILSSTELPRGTAAAARRAAQLWQLHTAAAPLAVFSPPGTHDDRTIVRYLHECTVAGDRIWETTGNFATGYYADRGVVQQMFWYGGFRREPEQEAQTLAWLADQRVPLLVARGFEVPLDVFKRHPRILAYVREHYRDVTSSLARSPEHANGRAVAVFARRDLVPLRTYEPLDLPCFAPAPRAAE